MTGRVDSTGSYTQVFDDENHLKSVARTGTGTTTFTYDANGQRVKTVKPNGDTVYTPFPQYEEELRGAVSIKRRAYAVAGQAIAMQVSGDPLSSNNGIFYYLTDHLGSTSMLITSSNGIASGSTARYLPYGAWRTTPTPTAHGPASGCRPRQSGRKRRGGSWTTHWSGVRASRRSSYYSAAVDIGFRCASTPGGAEYAALPLMKT
jgi:YD repeat-containing protein